MSSIVNTIVIGTATAAALLQGSEASIETCASAWKSAGGPNCATAVAVCAAESGGNTQARNVNSDSHHSVDRGLWQINDYWHPEVSDSCAFNAGCNARAALQISGGGSNWTPWATYNGGAYRSHLSQARSACGELAPQEAAIAGNSLDSIYDVKSFERTASFDTQVGGQPKSCIKKLKKLCGHCGTSKGCWLSCAKSHESDLLAAGCKKPKSEELAIQQPTMGGEPASCVNKLKALCGHCGTSKGCWLSCAKSHESDLLNAGCKKPASVSSSVHTVDTEEPAPLHTTKEIRMHHEYDQHCALLSIPGGKKSKFWKNSGYKYDHFKKGRCPHKFNYINKRVSNVEGYANVNLQVRGMYKPKRSFRDVVSKFGSANACPADPCECCPNDGKGPGACPCLCGGGWCKRCCQ